MKAKTASMPKTKTAMRFMVFLPGYRFGGSLPLGNDGQQEVWRLAGRKVQRIAAGENLRRPVVRVDVQERADALHRVGRVRERGVLAVDFVILAAHGEGKPVAGRHGDRSRPDFDVEFDRFARLERPFLIMGMPRPVGQRLFWIELALGGAQPAEPDRRARVIRPYESDFLAVHIEQTQR